MCTESKFKIFEWSPELRSLGGLLVMVSVVL